MRLAWFTDEPTSFSYRGAMSWRHVFELLDRLLGPPGVHGQVHDVGGGRLVRLGLPPGPRGDPVLGPHELVVMELVAPGPGVALVLGHGVGDALVHVDINLGAQHRHVVTWTRVSESQRHGVTQRRVSLS